MSDRDLASRRSDAELDDSANSQLFARRTMTVGSAQDPAEANADELARLALQRLGDGVSAAVEPSMTRVARSTAGPTPGAVVGAAGGELDPDTHRQLDSSRGGGRPMAEPVRHDMESAFGADFGRVRVHDGPAADTLSRKMQAVAFTVGNDMFFSAGAYEPRSSAGQHLLAHELGHVTQNDPGARVQRAFGKSKAKRPSVSEKTFVAQEERMAVPGKKKARGAVTDEHFEEEQLVVPGKQKKRGALKDVQYEDQGSTEAAQTVAADELPAVDGNDSVEESEVPDRPRAALPKIAVPDTLPSQGQTKSLTQLRDALAATMSASSRRHADRVGSSLGRLLGTMDEVESMPNAERLTKRAPAIEKMVGYAGWYLAGHDTSSDSKVQARVGIVGDIEGVATVEHIRASFDAKYSSLVIADDQSNPDSFKTASNAAQDLDEILNGLAASRDPNRAASRQIQETRDATLAYGLTKAELIAIRTYSDNDYRYINPAMGDYEAGVTAYSAGLRANTDGQQLIRIKELAASNGIAMSDKQAQRLVDSQLTEVEAEKAMARFLRLREWKGDPEPLKKALISRNQNKESPAESKKRVADDGTAHANFLQSGLAKVPPTAGTTYRGDNMSLARMKDVAWLGKEVTLSNFFSTSAESYVAHSFMDKGGAGPVRVLTEFRCIAARNISMLSLVPYEMEWLLMSGAKYRVISVEDYTGLDRAPLVGVPSDKKGPKGEIPTYYVTVVQTQ